MARKKRTTNQEVKKWDTAIVVRLSKEDIKKTKDKNSDSIESQIKLIEEHIQKMVDEGENISIHDYYIDDGKSGALAQERPAFMRLINDIENGLVNCVVVKDASRLARNSKESSEYVEEYFVRKDVRYISLMLPTLDTYKNPEEIGSLSTKIYDVVNEDYLRQTSLKIREIRKLKMRLGLFIGAYAPYGFKKDPENKHQLIVDEYASSILCSIRDWLFSGMTIKQIQIELHKLNVLNPTAYRLANGEKYNNPHYKPGKENWWNVSTIKRLLKSQMNIGDMVQNYSSTKSYKIKEKVYFNDDERIIVENTHTGFFSSNDRKRILSILDRETKTLSSSDNKPQTYLFTGFLKCGDCGRSITRKYQGNKENGYFQCKNYVDYGNEVCSRHFITEPELIKAVLYDIRAQISLIGDYETFFKDIQDKKNSKLLTAKISRALEKHSNEKDKLINIKDGLYMDWKNGDLSHDDYIRLKYNIEIKLDDIKKSLNELKKEATEIESGNYEDVFKKFKEHKNITQLDRSIITELIDRIYVYENKEIEIVYRFTNQLEAIKEKRENIKKKTLSKIIPQ